MKISVVGCSLGDFLFTGIDFSGSVFARYRSRRPGDGGLEPGKLVFADALSKFSGVPVRDILLELSGSGKPDNFNLGGPAIVGAINACQLSGPGCDFEFFGRLGRDETGDMIMKIVSATGVGTGGYLRDDGLSPFTWVLSDPSYHNGKGERCFINNVGVAGNFSELPDEFFDGDVHFYGATALTFGIHDTLSRHLRRSKAAGKVTMVSTVFDFRNELRDPVGRWPMGDGDEAYRFIDLLAVDWDEAVRLSGCDSPETITDFFLEKGVGSVVITHGAKDYYAVSAGTFFAPRPLVSLPVAAVIDEYLAEDPSRRGDTTGCGDNFAGGLLTGVVRELAAGKKPGELSLAEACAWAGVSGGFACTTVGGTYHESRPGEKLEKVSAFIGPYRKQLAPFFA